MIKRTPGFLSDNNISHNDSEIFDYIKELHEYLWRFVRVSIPRASGKLNDFVDVAINIAEGGRVINDEAKLSENVKNKLAEAVEAWADENLAGQPTLLATCVYYSLESELLKKQKEIDEKFPPKGE